MTRNALHENSQFGYKQYNSTETMLLGLTDEILHGFDSNKCTVIIFLDLSAAFDTIDIDKLFEILHFEIGVKGTALKWFHSFLSGRTQKVIIDNSFSDSIDIQYGVQQGSSLGPFLFSIHT